MNESETIRTMLGPSTKEHPRSIAVIGLSDVPSKPSHYVSLYMQQHGYKIYPINPSLPEVLGEKSYPSLTDLIADGHKPDIVNVFRLPKFIPAIVDEMLALRLPNLWVQQGIVNLEAAARAEAGGIHVVMDRCIMVVHRYMATS
jgi:predicted CoA-binding protein